MRKTKIVCTLGPSTDNEEVMRQLMLEGMNVARCNFSHGVYEEHKKRMDMVKKIRKEVKKPVAILCLHVTDDTRYKICTIALHNCC